MMVVGDIERVGAAAGDGPFSHLGDKSVLLIAFLTVSSDHALAGGIGMAWVWGHLLSHNVTMKVKCRLPRRATFLP